MNSNLQAIAVKVYFPVEMYICNIYLPPSLNYSKQDLLNLINQLPKPYIICGDFNAHSAIWGCTKTNPKGKIIES